MRLTDRPNDRALRISDQAFSTVEHGVYVVLGIVLSLTAIMGLVLAIGAMWSGLWNGSAGEALLVIVGRLLFVLMLAEILHTVRVSLTSGTLNCEPFLIVGLIASIRRVLVITLESSQTASGHPAADEHQTTFQASMIELGVLAGLILVMVISIYLLRRAGSSFGR
jgi:uncharacterized membrane protein (DUF373 family)